MVDSISAPQEIWRQRLRERLIDSGLSMPEVSWQAGFDGHYMRQVLDDGLEPSLDKLQKLCDVLDMNASELFQ